MAEREIKSIRIDPVAWAAITAQSEAMGWQSRGKVIEYMAREQLAQYLPPDWLPGKKMQNDEADNEN